MQLWTSGFAAIGGSKSASFLAAPANTGDVKAFATQPGARQVQVELIGRAPLGRR